MFRLQQVIAVYEGDQFSSGKPDSRVARDRGSAILPLLMQPDEVISGVGFQPLDRTIARTIVNNDDFKIPVCLPVYSFQALADPLPPVVGRHDETGEWVTHADCRHTPRIDLPNSRSSSGSINVERGINLLSQKLI